MFVKFICSFCCSFTFFFAVKQTSDLAKMLERLHNSSALLCLYFVFTIVAKYSHYLLCYLKAKLRPAGFLKYILKKLNRKVCSALKK